jgi:hypothetical protein
MYSDKRTRALPRVGFPIRTSRDQRLVSTYSGLIAAAHVLLRLLAPRHPPCALILLINEEHRVCRYGVFKVRAATCHVEQPPRRPVSQNSAALETSRSTLFQASRITGQGGNSAAPPASPFGQPGGRPSHARRGRVPSTGSAPAGVRAPASLERR